MRRHRLAVVLAAALTIGGGALAYTSRADSRPQSVVRDYFAALGRGDAPGALALARPPAGNHEFLTSDVLREQLNVASLRDIRASGASAGEVDYAYDLRFADHTQHVSGQVHVVRQDEDWRLAQPAVSVRPTLAGADSRATLAGAAMPDDTVAVFPGALPVRFDTRNLTLSGATASVTFGDSSERTVNVTLSARGRAVASEAVSTLLRRCFRPDASAGPECPLPPDPRIVPGSLRGTAIAHALGYEVSTASAGTVVVTARASFTGRYSELDVNELAHSHRGDLDLELYATAPAGDLGALRWTDPAS